MFEFFHSDFTFLSGRLLGCDVDEDGFEHGRGWRLDEHDLNVCVNENQAFVELKMFFRLKSRRNINFLLN
jgi:hypothetical protein